MAPDRARHGSLWGDRRLVGGLVPGLLRVRKLRMRSMLRPLIKNSKKRNHTDINIKLSKLTKSDEQVKDVYLHREWGWGSSRGTLPGDLLHPRRRPICYCLCRGV